MSKVVVDACVSAKWVLSIEKDSDKARGLLEDWLRNRVEIHVPVLWEYELDSVFRRHVRKGRMTQDQAESYQRTIGRIPVKIRYQRRFRVRAREIAEQANQERVYDSVYAALAESENCELWTADGVFHKAVAGFLPSVKYLGDFSPPNSK